MDSCDYKRDSGGRCGSRDYVKEVEFRHPTYKDLSMTCFLCVTHFGIVFGKPLLTSEHFLPLEEEAYLVQNFKRQKELYKKELEEITERVRAGIGLEFFDMKNWKMMRYQRVDHAYKTLNNLRRKQCRFEHCKQFLTNWRNMYVIRLYPKNQRDYVNLLFCSLNHWEVFKKRIGLIGLRGSLNQTIQKITSLPLESYAEPKKN